MIWPIHYVLVQIMCVFYLDGQYGNGSICTDCPDDSFSPTWNSTIDDINDCIPCSEGSNTNHQTGLTNCTHCDDGFYGNGR